MSLGRKNVHVMQASRLLQSKVGSGNIPESKLQKLEEHFENYKTGIDVSDIANEYAMELKKLIDAADITNEEEERIVILNDLRRIVMQLKANTTMFHMEAIGKIADTMLKFVENIGSLDKDIINVLIAHHASISLLFESKRQNDKGAETEALANELAAACQRYYKKHPELIPEDAASNSDDVFFVST